MIPNLKIFAGAGLIVVLLGGVVWAQQQRVSSLKDQRQALRAEVQSAVAQVSELLDMREREQDLIRRRNEERRLLYAELDGLKRKTARLQDEITVAWRAAAVPEPIRLLYAESTDSPPDSAAD